MVGYSKFKSKFFIVSKSRRINNRLQKVSWVKKMLSANVALGINVSSLTECAPDTLCSERYFLATKTEKEIRVTAQFSNC